MRRIDQKVKKLQDQFPLIEGICRLPNNRGGIHLGNSAEGGRIVDAECRRMAKSPEWAKLGDWLGKDATLAADYYGVGSIQSWLLRWFYSQQGRGDYPWIHPDLEKAVKSIGYEIEWVCAGALVAYPA